MLRHYYPQRISKTSRDCPFKPNVDASFSGDKRYFADLCVYPLPVIADRVKAERLQGQRKVKLSAVPVMCKNVIYTTVYPQDKFKTLPKRKNGTIIEKHF